jgi:hypothetical protein
MLLYLLQSAVVILVPLYFIVALARAKEADRLSWLLKASYSGAFIAYVSMMGRWDLVSVYVRYAIVVLYVGAVLWSFRNVRRLPFVTRNRAPRRSMKYAASGVMLLFFSGFAAWTARGYFYSDEPVELTFPLQSGWYYVGQGGNTRIVNYHNVDHAQRYALDIVALNRGGARARGLHPRELDRYVIFDHPVHSPCDGRAQIVVDGLPDLVPPQSDRRNLAGNHVVIACKGVIVLLAHMRQGSIVIRQNDEIRTGQPLGRVGNTGNTSEPHLHMHAVRAGSGDIMRGEGVPVLFEGVFAVRNTTFRVSRRDAAQP